MKYKLILFTLLLLLLLILAFPAQAAGILWKGEADGPGCKRPNCIVESPCYTSFKTIDIPSAPGFIGIDFYVDADKIQSTTVEVGTFKVTGTCKPDSDLDNDGLPDSSDPDIDGDGILNGEDDTPFGNDTNGDGAPDEFGSGNGGDDGGDGDDGDDGGGGGGGGDEGDGGDEGEDEEEEPPPECEFSPPGLLDAFVAFLPDVPESMRLSVILSEIAGEGTLAGNAVLVLVSGVWQFLGILLLIKLYKLLPFT